MQKDLWIELDKVGLQLLLLNNSTIMYLGMEKEGGLE
jgi:hypothetical protein